MQIEIDSTLRFPSMCPHRVTMTDALTFDNPSYASALAMATSERSKAYMTQHLDPKIRFYSEDYESRKITTPIGIKDKLFNLCKSCHYNCPIIDNRSTGAIIEPRELVKPLIPRGWQVSCLEVLSNTVGQTGIGGIRVVTGGGKTILAILLQLKTNLPTLFITHTKDLAFSAMDDYEEFFGVPCGLIGNGKDEEDSHFTVAIINSLHKKQKYEEWSRKYGLVIFDEVHRVAGSMSTEVMNNLRCKYRVGLTATTNRGDGLEEAVMNAIGPVVYELSKSQALDEKIIVPIRAEILETDFVPSAGSTLRPRDVKTAAKEASQNHDRNKIINRKLEEIAETGELTLLVLNDIGQCHYQYEMSKNSKFIKGEIFTGAQNPKKRSEIIRKAKSGEINALFTVKLASIGLNIPRIQHMIMDQKISDPLTVEQIAGRVVRSCKDFDKRFATVYDVYDKYCSTFANQTKKRLQVYRKFIGD